MWQRRVGTFALLATVVLFSLPAYPFRDYRGREVDTSKPTYLWATIYCPASFAVKAAANPDGPAGYDLRHALIGDVLSDGRMATDAGCRQGDRIEVYDVQDAFDDYVAFNTTPGAKWRATPDAIGVPMWVTFSNRISNEMK